MTGKQTACQTAAVLLSCYPHGCTSAAFAVDNTAVAEVNGWFAMQAIGRVVAIGLGTAFAIVQASLCVLWQARSQHACKHDKCDPSVKVFMIAVATGIWRLHHCGVVQNS